jgi:hypothetical protein
MTTGIFEQNTKHLLMVLDDEKLIDGLPPTVIKIELTEQQSVEMSSFDRTRMWWILDNENNPFFERLGFYPRDVKSATKFIDTYISELLTLDGWDSVMELTSSVNFPQYNTPENLKLVDTVLNIWKDIYDPVNEGIKSYASSDELLTDLKKY